MDYSESVNLDKNLAFLWGEGNGFIEAYLQLQAQISVNFIILITSST